MKIGQVIEQMLQDEDKEFEGEMDGRRYLISVICGKIELMIRYGEVVTVTHELPSTWKLRSIDWDLVRPAVSFMDACNSEKMFKVSHELIESSVQRKSFNLSSFVLYLNQNRHDAAEIRKILRDGQFFIIQKDVSDPY